MRIGVKMIDRIGLQLAAVGAALAVSGAARAGATAGFDNNLGGGLVGGDDGGAQVVNLPFAVSLFGQSYSTLNVSTNGYLTLTNLAGIDGLDLSADTWRPNIGGFLNEQARIAPEWFDWVSDTSLSETADRIMVTWTGAQYGSDVTHIAQAQIYSDGRIVFAYDDPTGPTGTVIAGITTGEGASDPGATNFLGANFIVNGPQAIYELSAGGGFPNNVPVTFTPDGNGGYTVQGGVPPLPDPADGGGVPEPATWALLLSGFGLAGAALRARRRIATPG
ncbi:MAG: PEPxxWA-CTERM sorting domain-containing protein [Proteobacteria bacterium]|nr:PEPxxWA-CTERM sorting domain-containing protein [Pseudomonadota bacterium]